MSVLIDRFESETGKSVVDAIDAFIAFCCDVAQKESMSVASFRAHLYASSRVLKKSGIHLTVDEIVRQAYPQWAKAGEANRARILDEHILKEIRFEAETEGIESLSFAYRILLVGMYFGVRPIEIHGTRFGDSEEFSLPVLYVSNAKKKKEENAIPERALMVVDKSYCSEALTVYRSLVEVAQTMRRDEWKRFYAPAQHILSRRRFLTKRGELVHLYSGRHHFVSLARQHKVPKREIQALLGHKLLATQRFYGIKRFRLFKEKIFHVVAYPTQWVPEITLEEEASSLR